MPIANEREAGSLPRFLRYFLLPDEPAAPQEVTWRGAAEQSDGNAQVDQESQISLFAHKRVLVVEDEYFLANRSAGNSISFKRWSRGLHPAWKRPLL
jgi:hypothetical protein